MGFGEVNSKPSKMSYQKYFNYLKGMQNMILLFPCAP